MAAGSPAEVLGPEPTRPARWWLRILLAAVLAAGLLAWRAVDRHREADATRRADAPVLQRLSALEASGSLDGARGLIVVVAYREDASSAPFKVTNLSLDAGGLGEVRAVLLNHFTGSGLGPRLEEVEPFTAPEEGFRLDLSFQLAPTCGVELPGDPPLLVTVQLPSGHTTTLHLRIDHVWNPRLGGSPNDPHRPWPRLLTEFVCA